jgi:hypothetical protein
MMFGWNEKGKGGKELLFILRRKKIIGAKCGPTRYVLPFCLIDMATIWPLRPTTSKEETNTNPFLGVCLS